MSSFLAQPGSWARALGVTCLGCSLFIQQTFTEDVLCPRRDAGEPEVNKVRSQSREKRGRSYMERGYLSPAGVIQTELDTGANNQAVRGGLRESSPNLRSQPSMEVHRGTSFSAMSYLLR